MTIGVMHKGFRKSLAWDGPGPERENRRLR